MSTIPLSSLTQDILVKAFDIYFKHAYPNEQQRRAEIRFHLQAGDISPDAIKVEFLKHHSIEWRLGNHQWQHMKMWLHKIHGKHGDSLDPRWEIYWEVQENDHGEDSIRRRKNKEIALAVRREWAEKGIPCDTRGL